MKTPILSNKYAILGIVLVVMLLGNHLRKDSPIKTVDKKVITKATVTPIKNPFEKVYYGVIPCDSICKEDELTLILDMSEGDSKGTYRLIEKRVGQWNTNIEFDGNWVIGEGMDDDPDAKIIVLNPEDEETIVGFLVLDDKRIESLDEYGYRYENSEDYVLNLQ